jgi:hypothetical protein
MPTNLIIILIPWLSLFEAVQLKLPEDAAPGFIKSTREDKPALYLHYRKAPPAATDGARET